MNSWGVGEEVEYWPHPDHKAPAIFDGIAPPIRGKVKVVKADNLYYVQLDASAGGETVQLHGDQLRLSPSEPDRKGRRRPPNEVLTALSELAYVQGHLEGMSGGSGPQFGSVVAVMQAMREDAKRLDAARAVVNKYLFES